MAGNTDRMAMLRETAARLSKEEEEPKTETEETEEVPEPEAEEAPEPAEKDEAPTEEPEKPDKPARDRDDKGRFAPADRDAPKKPAPAKVEATPKAPAPTKPAAAPALAPEAPKVPELKPPQSLKPSAREAWNKAPPEMRPLLEDVTRLEGETRRVLNENAQIRKVAQEALQYRQGVEEMVGPYAGVFRAEGVEPLQGVKTLVDTYGALHYGSQQQKDAILASLVAQFGSLDGINAHLEGKAAAPQQYQPPPPRQAAPDPRAIVREEFQALRQQAENDAADRALEEFLATGPEFIDKVWTDMRAVLQSSHEAGRKLTYRQAYDRACRMDEEIQGILDQRATAAAATAQPSAPAQRARVAAATIQSKPAGVGDSAPDPRDRMAMIRAAAARRG